MRAVRRVWISASGRAVQRKRSDLISSQVSVWLLGQVDRGHDNSSILTRRTRATHSKQDDKNAWPEPEAIKFEWSGKTKDGKPVEAVLEAELEQRLDRIDVMAEVPGFVKQIVAGAAGTKPYIYQVSYAHLAMVC